MDDVEERNQNKSESPCSQAEIDLQADESSAAQGKKYNGTSMPTPVIRIINLPETTSNDDLREFLRSRIELKSSIENVYVRKLNRPINTASITFAYVIFNSCDDADSTVNILNGTVSHNGEKFSVSLIHPSIDILPISQKAIFQCRRLQLRPKYCRNNLRTTVSNIKCRTCNIDHFSWRCPTKSALAGRKQDDKPVPLAGLLSWNSNKASSSSSKYIPPALSNRGVFASSNIHPAKVSPLPTKNQDSLNGESTKAAGSKYIPPNMRNGAVKRTYNLKKNHNDNIINQLCSLNGESTKAAGSKYIPPNMRNGAVKRTYNLKKNHNDNIINRIANLNLRDSTSQSDLENFEKPIGSNGATVSPRN